MRMFPHENMNEVCQNKCLVNLHVAVMPKTKTKFHAMPQTSDLNINN